MKCPNCDKQLRDDAKFCTGCGRQIPRCPACGKVLQRRARFCPADGTPIPEQIIALIPETQQAPPPEKKTAAKKEQSRQEKPKKERGGSALTVVLVTLLAVLVLAVAALAAAIGMGWIDLGGAELPAFVDHLGGQEDPTDPDETDPLPETEPETDPPTEAETVPATTPPLMPDCVGMLYTDAEDILLATVRVLDVTYVYSDDVAKDYVVAQSVPENTELFDDSTVTLTVSLGPDVSPDGYNQKVVVSAGNGSTNGTLTLYDWENGQWVSKFSCDATVGKNGIGTDYGEGKKKTPQGTFKLGVALSANGIPNSTWPHQYVTSDTCVVDDMDSAYYNTIRNISDLSSGVSYDPVGNTLLKGYSNALIYIEHNGNGLDSDNVVAGKGSVITICGKTSAIEATAGCVDISASNMTTLLSLLVYEENPHIEILVQ